MGGSVGRKGTSGAANGRTQGQDRCRVNGGGVGQHVEVVQGRRATQFSNEVSGSIERKAGTKDSDLRPLARRTR